MSGPSSPPEEGRPPAPVVARVVGMLDLFLGFWAIAIALGFIYLRFENYRMVVNGQKVNMLGVFYGIAVNAAWLASAAGMDGVPGGPRNGIPGSPPLTAFGNFKIMNVFVAMAGVYIALALAWFAMADGLWRGLRWARRAHVIAGWLGLAAVAGYAALYLMFAPDAPRAGLLVVAGAAVLPASMVRAGEAARDPGGARPRRLGLPAWLLIALGSTIVAMAAHFVLAWWVLLFIRANYL